MIDKTARALGQFNEIAIRVCGVSSAGCLAAMTLIILLQVFCRYVLNAPLAWPEEIARFLMVWMAFLAAPYAYRNDLFVRLETWIGRFPVKFQHRVTVGIQFILIGLFIALLRESIWMVDRGSVIRASSINISMGWVFAVLPATFLLLIGVSIEKIVNAIRKTDGTGVSL
jgi:TRAP-type C4-dicarboxylate transport system permease small subunit